MTDYWSKLKLNECWSAKQRYNKILNQILNDTEEEEEIPVTRKISFTVTNEDIPINGAIVRIDESETLCSTTGSAGGCNIDGVTDGEHTVTATFNGFEDYSDTITTSENDTSFDITLVPLVYEFDSYESDEKEEVKSEGTLSLTGVVSDGYNQVTILTDSSESEELVNNTFYIINSAEFDGTTAYQLYSDAGTTGTGVYITISVSGE